MYGVGAVVSFWGGLYGVGAAVSLAGLYCVGAAVVSFWGESCGVGGAVVSLTCHRGHRGVSALRGDQAHMRCYRCYL